MLKIGVITDEISQDLQVACDLAKKYGLQGVEIRSVWDKGPHKLEEEDIAKIQEITKDTGLEVCGISAPFFKSDIDSEEELKEQYVILDRCVALAQKLNAPYVRGFTFWSKGNFDDYFDRIVKNLQDAAKHIEGTGITLVIEMDPSVFGGDAARVAKIVGAVNRPNVRGLFDPGNLVWNPNHEIPYPDAYETMKPYIAHVHVKDAGMVDGKIDAVKVGTGCVDFKGLFRRLIADGYDGYVVLETHYRLKSKISAELLALPGGAAFSDGAFPATDESLAALCDMIANL